MSKIISKYRLLVLFFFLVSGFSGLIYQVLWARQFKILLGSSITSVSIIVAAFMAGLLIGAWYIGNRIEAKGVRNELKLYAYLELFIGFYGLILLLGLEYTQPLFSLFGEPSTSFNFIRLIGNSLLTFTILVLPTAAMGATLPLLLNYFNKVDHSFRKSAAQLYSINALGGAFASILTGFFLIKNFGVNGSIGIAISLNLFIGLFALAWSKKPMQEINDVAQKSNKLDSNQSKFLISTKAIITIAFFTGFIAIAYEVLWIRCLNFILNNSTYTFSIILSIFLLGLSIGSMLVSYFKKLQRKVLLLAVTQFLLAVCVLLIIYLFYSFGESQLFDSILSQEGDLIPIWYREIGANLIFSLVVFLLPTILMGISFPLIAELYFELKSIKAGTAISKVYAINTLGSILGAIVPVFILVPLFGGIKPSLYFFAFINLLIAIYLIYKSNSSKKLIYCLAFGGVFALLFISTKSNEMLISIENTVEGSSSKTLFYKEGRMATVKVFDNSTGKRSLSIDGVTIASSGFKAKESCIAHLPFFTDVSGKNILAVGLASGSTVGSILKHKEVEQIDIVEIIPSVIDVLDFFKESNLNVKEHPKANIYIDDIISFLNRTEKKYDIISSDGKFSVVNKANTVMLSKNYYDLCLDHLTENGIFIQWVSSMVPNHHFKTILATTESSFNYSEMFLIRENLFILSSAKPISLDQQKITEAFNDPIIQNDLYGSNLYTSAELMSYYIGPNKDIGLTQKFNTFNNPYIEYNYNREFENDIKTDGTSSLKNLKLLFEKYQMNKETILTNYNTISQNQASVSFDLNKSFFDSRINYVLGIRAEKANDTKKAYTHLIKVIQENHPENNNDIAVSAKIIGEHFLQKKLYKEALPYFDISISKLDGYDNAYALRGVANYYLKNKAESRADFTTAKSLNPRNQTAIQFLAILNKEGF